MKFHLVTGDITTLRGGRHRQRRQHLPAGRRRSGSGPSTGQPVRSCWPSAAPSTAVPPARPRRRRATAFRPNTSSIQSAPCGTGAEEEQGCWPPATAPPWPGLWLRCRTVAFPAISTGVYHYPPQEAAAIIGGRVPPLSHGTPRRTGDHLRLLQQPHGRHLPAAAGSGDGTDVTYACGGLRARPGLPGIVRPAASTISSGAVGVLSRRAVLQLPLAAGAGL